MKPEKPRRPRSPSRQGKPSTFHGRQSTAWDAQASWYDRLVGEDGSAYHKEVVLPGTMELLAPASGERILDLGCGQGVFCRLLAAAGVEVTGVDLSSELIEKARGYRSSGIEYRVEDACALSDDLRQGSFDAAVSILAVGNMASLPGFFQGAADAVRSQGRLVIVIMHPCFRIPRQSHWQYDETKKLQYRRIDRYLSPLSIPIITHPGKKNSPYTMMFHRPLHEIINEAADAGWMITGIREWTSNRRSVGAKARAENRAREEFPLFLAIQARKS